MKAFLKRKNVEISLKRYGIDALGAMALGLFASLLIGTIIKTIGENIGHAFLSEKLVEIGTFASSITGGAVAVAIGHAIYAPPLVLLSLVAVGQATNTLGGAGGLLAVLFVTIIATEAGKIVSKETKVDILLTPAVTVLVGISCAYILASPIAMLARAFGEAVMFATKLQPFFMGIIVSAIVGMILTLPISSAAICAALSLTGLAGGAALAGCCTQMVGFAVMSYRENGVGGLVAQGLGTSMLQIPNIIKNWKIWIPPTVASMIVGPIATCIFKLEQNGAAVASGMGTSGLVGQIGVLTGWAKRASTFDYVGLVLISFVLPAVFTWLIAIPCRKYGWIKEGDLKIHF